MRVFWTTYPSPRDPNVGIGCVRLQFANGDYKFPYIGIVYREELVRLNWTAIFLKSGEVAKFRVFVN
jgi:hypothetical protein